MTPLPLARCLLAALSLLGACAAAGSDQINYSPAPAWVSAPPAPGATTLESRSGIVVVFEDTQVQVEEETTYFRQVLRVVAPDGLAQVGELHFVFDPAYETLALHHVRIQRGDTTLDRLDPSRVQVLRRERDAEAGLFDGRLTALLVLDDVRVGDTLDIASSTRGRNPVFGGRYATTFALQSFSPIESQRVRVLAAPERGLRLQTRGSTQAPPEPATAGSLLEWVAEGRSVASAEFEFDAPDWFQQIPILECSEFPDWAAVAQWGCGLFAVDATPTPDLELLLRDLRSLEAEKSILAALHRIQDDVRYLSLSLGESSHRPHPPAEVLARRLGDCKDKAALLAFVLRSLGHDAVPALVLSSGGRSLDTRLPSPHAFDHAIVQLVYDHRTYWLDPTQSYQAGSLDDHAVGDFHLALPLRPTTTQLVAVELPRRARPRISINETYTSTAFDKPATLSVRRKYSGSLADGMRAYLRDTPAEKVGKDQLNHYARVHPTIEQTAVPAWTDDRETNEIELRESYRLPGLWEPGEDDGSVVATFIPVALHDVITQPEQPVRDTPFGWGHPLEIVNHITVILPDAWEVEREAREEKFACFTLGTDIRYTNQRLDLNYQYTSTADHVAMEKVPEFSAQIGKLQDRLGYQLTHFPNGAVGVAPEAFALNLPVAMLFFLVLAGGVFGGWKLVAHKRPADAPPPMPVSPELNGLGGWLVLVCISLFVGIAMSATGLKVLVPLTLDVHQWKLVTEPGMPGYHAMFAPLLMFEGAFHILRIVAAITGLVLFFSRKQVFRRFMIAMIGCIVAFTIIDGLGAAMLPADDPSANMEAGAEAFRAIFYAAIWIPYFLKSRRVQATFVR